MKEIDKNIEMIIGYDLSECRYDNESFMVDKLKMIIPEIDIGIYSVVKEGVEIIYSNNLYKLLLESNSNHITGFIYDEVLPQIEKIGNYFNDETIEKIENAIAWLPEEELSEDYINDGSLSDAMDLYNKAKKVKKRTKKWINAKNRFENLYDE